MVTSVEFKDGMRQLSGAVSIVTTLNEGVPAGMTATAVCSLTADPPQLLVCINKSATAYHPIRTARRFAVNVLSSEDLGTARRFSVGDMKSRFEVGLWRPLASGNPALQSALVTFDCSLCNDIPVETHSILIGRVEEIVLRSKSTPLIYLDGQYGHGVTPSSV
jgi:flavin reductase (DIM6/NTAB) family NADH-FMN oxidoreductase RutF